jgi:hypothetical protein
LERVKGIEPSSSAWKAVVAAERGLGINKHEHAGALQNSCFCA